jgi:integrase
MKNEARERGLGRIYQPKYRDRATRGTKVQAVWWIQYYYRGQKRRESSGSTNRRDAVALLKTRIGEMGQRKPIIGRDVERTTFEDLATMLEQDYKANARRSLGRVEASIEHLRGVFATVRAVDLTADRITAYVATRHAEGAANATINRELAALKRMFRLGERAGKVVGRPYIGMLTEDNARTGFFEVDQFRAVLAELPDALGPVFETAYITGWRVKSEILTRQWSHVDARAGWLRLEPGETKNREGRMFPLTPELRAVLERQREATEAAQRETGGIVPWLFFRVVKPGRRRNDDPTARTTAEPIKSFRRAWLTACKRAGVPSRIPHDFRRTAVRNLERAGVPRSAAMKMVGHKTEAIYRRYAIVAESDLRAGAEKLSALHQAEQDTPRKVVSLRAATDRG